jgi:predicted amidohydrolase
MSSDRLTVAAVQMSSQDNQAQNLEQARAGIEEAAARGARLIVLPENFAYMGTEAKKRELAEPIGEGTPGPVLRALVDAAKRANAYVVGGGMAERSSDPNRPYNTCVVVAPDGSISGKYRKIHLFDVDLGQNGTYRESASTTPGESPVMIEAAGWWVGLSICYDVRFPELYRALSSAGAELIVVPAAFTLATGKDHWHVLLRARAIEAQAFVVAAAQWGSHPQGRQTYGKSLVVDAWGDVVAQASEGPGIVVTTLDRAFLNDVRRRLPSLEHRRIGPGRSLPPGR